MIFNVTNLVYVLWASGEVQPFNTPHLINKAYEEEGAVTTKSKEDDEKSPVPEKKIEYVKE